MMISVRSNAKINVGLNICGILPNNYHELHMTMLPIELSDILNINFLEKTGNLKIKCSNPHVPTDEKNILFKIYKKFYEITKIIPQEIEVEIEKNIPMEAGLGGGSSNGAFFLLELNKFHKNILSLDEMISFSKNIGADIPFFLENKSAEVFGIGEKLKFFKNNLDAQLILIKPNFGVSTKVAFENFKTFTEAEKNNKADIKKIITGFSENNLELIEKNIINHLEIGLLKTNNELKNFKNILDSTGLKFFMTGSGSVYFAFLEKETKNINLNNMQKDFIIIRTQFIK